MTDVTYSVWTRITWVVSVRVGWGSDGRIFSVIILSACNFSSCCCGCFSCSRLSGSNGYSFGRVEECFRGKGTGLIAVSALYYTGFYSVSITMYFGSPKVSRYVIFGNSVKFDSFSPYILQVFSMWISFSYSQSSAPCVNGGRGCLPYVSIKGDMWVVALSMPLQWKLTSLSSVGHEPLDSWRSSKRHDNTCLTKPMLRSAIPSHWGWCGVVCRLSILSGVQNPRNSSPSNCDPCSVMMISGTPCPWHTHPCSNATTTLANVWSRSGTSSINRLNKSTINRKYRNSPSATEGCQCPYLLLPLGNPYPIISIRWVVWICWRVWTVDIRHNFGKRSLIPRHLDPKVTPL